MVCIDLMHQPVFLKEVLELFDPRPGQTYIDATANGGGHSGAIAECISPGGILLGIDRDCDIMREARRRFADHPFHSTMIFECANYADMKAIAKKRGIAGADGILFDLGFSSYHTDESGRGFSFRRDEPLDMRYDIKGNSLTAGEIVNQWPEERIADMVRRYGEERYAERIAGAIARSRLRGTIASSAVLAGIVASAVPRRGRIHPATRTFQALRIAVNRELDSLESALPDAADLLRVGGRLLVISFHSLEDRIVKRFIRNQERAGALDAILKKPIQSSPEDTAINPRARSARLRGAIKR